jgi:hypothetical protein
MQKEDNDAFNRWWAAYPTTTRHAHYPATHTLKLHRPECKRLFLKAIEEGIDPEDLIRVLKQEVKQRKLNSSQRNELAFMPTSFNYLEKRYFEARLEELEEDNTNGDSNDRSSTILF